MGVDVIGNGIHFVLRAGVGAGDIVVVFPNVVQQKQKFHKLAVDHQAAHTGIFDILADFRNVIQSGKQKVLFLPVKTVYGLDGIENRQDLPVSAGIVVLFWQHKANDNPVAGSSRRVDGLVQDRRRKENNVIGNHVITFSLHKMVGLGA